MKFKLLSRFRIKSLILFGIIIITIPLLIIPVLKGYSSDGQVFMFFGGIILFFFALFNILKNPLYYLVLSIIVVILWIIGWLIKFNPGEDIGMSLGFFLFAGCIFFALGIIKYTTGWSRLLYVSASLSIVVIPLLSVSLPPPPYTIYVTPLSETMAIVIQLLIAILLMMIGYINRKDNSISKALVILIAVISVLLGLWGIIAPALENDMSNNFWKFTARIYALVQILIASIAFYSCRPYENKKI
jgi:hypothetical protein